jgi:hypothetical protein
MKKRPPEDPERFQDPLGAHIRAVSTAHAKRMERYASVNEVYQGFYADFTPQSEEGARYLSGVEGIIGSTLKLERFEDALAFVAHDGQQIALLEGAVATWLEVLLERGWVIRCVLASIIYSAGEKSFTGNFACLSYSPQLEDEVKQSLETFIGNITHRVASATRPKLELTQEQFVRVIESKGTWFLTREEPWPELPKGSVVYRRRRTFSDRLINIALEGNRGCVVASWVATVIIIGAAIFFVWFFFLSGR